MLDGGDSLLWKMRLQSRGGETHVVQGCDLRASEKVLRAMVISERKGEKEKQQASNTMDGQKKEAEEAFLSDCGFPGFPINVVGVVAPSATSPQSPMPSD